MKPDIENAALKATEALILYGVSASPVDPIRVLKEIPSVVLVSYTELAGHLNVDRNYLVNAFGFETQDAVTYRWSFAGEHEYLIAINQRLPVYMLQRAAARELGHIILGHDGTRPEDVRMAEAYTFAHHFLCPRPLIRAIQESGLPFTVEVLGAMTGCYERCLQGMRKTPPVHVPAELNRKVKEQFADYIANFLDFESYLSKSDESMLVNLGTYMDGYEE